ncbi:hypothetical protein BWI97_24195 [Siphonobacter sp. BAB-5405]|uniref:DUF6493 family protein n=1 Tax=Siphonobacter sp. BAB-5405 TaxID=1864825 RepID=UPI000C7F8980|nr:DUF6493 family protein [Siphonobacter sp. BAB-5405]PMD90211.1 hypothetical protein BWI97_24195 [Siphonobacter sp. BAB-5405]
MSYPDQFEQLVKTLTFDALLPWVDALPAKDIKEVNVRIRQLAKANHATIGLHPRKESRGEFLLLAALALFTNQERINLPQYLAFYVKDVPLYQLVEVLKYAQSLAWANEWIRQSKQKNRWNGLTYHKLRVLLEQEVIRHDRKLFAEEMCLGYVESRFNNTSTPENLLYAISRDSFLISHDLESVFFYETAIATEVHFANRNLKALSWMDIYRYLIERKQLDRYRILQLCLEGLVRDDFSKDLLGWFRDLFTGLEPTPAELFGLQLPLLTLLNTESSLPLNLAMGHLKKMVFQEDFAWEEFLQRSEQVLSRTDVKNARKSILDILLKFPKAYPQTQSRVTELAVVSLLTTDPVIQEKATKIISQWGNTQDETLREQIDLYGSNLSAKSLEKLAAYETRLASTEQATYHYDPSPNVQLIREQNRIHFIRTWEELLYELTTPLRSDDPIKLERIMDAIVHLPALPSDAEEQVKPLLKSHSYAELSWDLDQLVALLLRDWIGGFQYARVHHYKPGKYHDPFIPFWQQRFKQIPSLRAATLPFLSTPTHAPCWISPSVLIERLACYQRAKMACQPFDFLLALARTRLEDTQEALTRLEKLEESEETRVLRFLLDPAQELVLPEQKKAFWQKMYQRFVASGERSDVTVEQSYYAVAARSKSPRANWEAFKTTDLGVYPNVSTLYPFAWEHEFEQQNHRWSKNPVIFQRLEFASEVHTQIPQTLLYSLHYPIHGRFEETQDYSFAADFLFSASLIPQYREPLYYRVLQVRALRYKTNQSDQQALEKALRSLLPEEAVFYEYGLMVLAQGFISAKATDRALAQEVFVQKIEQQKLDVRTLGQELGKLLKENFAPLQRVIDSLEALRRLSPLHEDALIQFIEQILLNQAYSQPPKNTAKLLSIYQDLLQMNRRRLPDHLSEHLNHWQQYPALKKTVLELSRI